MSARLQNRWKRRPAWGRHALSAVGAVVVLVVLAVLVLKLAPDWFAETSGLDEEAQAEARRGVRTTALALLGGALAVVGAVYTARTYELGRRRHELDREGQITERFTRAVEQLGHEGGDVQVGGIYALGRIMRDSPSDHGAVVDVLSAFVREHAAVQKAKDLAPVDTSGLGWQEGSRPERLRGNMPSRPPVAIQAAMIVLGGRPERPHGELDALRLSDTVLRRALLREARLTCVRLRGSHLEYAYLERASLEGARMPDAHLEYADLTEAHLEHAYLENAYLNRARLTGARLDHATLTGAKLDHATLFGAVMAGAKLDGASLLGAHLVGITGDPALTPEQRGQVHCSPTDPPCREADADGAPLPKDHPCARYEWSTRYL